jgi:ubiquinone/menaquinone biosynthesis C-methylase UbiE
VSEYDAAAFDSFEAAGWEVAAAGYDFFTATTRQSAQTLLDAAGVRAGSRALDLGTGPGDVAAQAAERGAAAVGIDVAAAMIELATRRHPALTFQVASATELPFPDASFDAVFGNLVILHVGRPELVARESVRVLAPGGRLALSTWDAPERSPLFAALIAAIGAVGVAPPADLPGGPSFFRFADDAEFTGLLVEAGVSDVAVETTEVMFDFGSIDELFTAFLEGTVRVAGMLRAASAEQHGRIREQVEDELASYRRDDTYRVSAPIKVASGERPS